MATKKTPTLLEQVEIAAKQIELATKLAADAKQALTFKDRYGSDLCMAYMNGKELTIRLVKDNDPNGKHISFETVERLYLWLKELNTKPKG